MNIPDTIPALMAVLAVAYWPVTAGILVACAVTAYMARSTGPLRIASAIVATLVIIDALAGAWWLWG